MTSAIPPVHAAPAANATRAGRNGLLAGALLADAASTTHSPPALRAQAKPDATPRVDWPLKRGYGEALDSAQEFVVNKSSRLEGNWSAVQDHRRAYAEEAGGENGACEEDDDIEDRVSEDEDSEDEDSEDEDSGNDDGDGDGPNQDKGGASLTKDKHINWGHYRSRDLSISDTDDRCPIITNGLGKCDSISTLDGYADRVKAIKRHVAWHSWQHKSDMKTPPMVCSYCNEQFCWTESLKNHLDKNCSERCQIRCRSDKKCTAKFNSNRAQSNHDQYVHGYNLYLELTSPTAISTGLDPSIAEQRVCHIHRMGFIGVKECRENKSRAHPRDPNTRMHLLECPVEDCGLRLNRTDLGRENALNRTDMDDDTDPSSARFMRLHLEHRHKGTKKCSGPGGIKRHERMRASTAAIQNFISRWPADVKLPSLAIIRRTSWPRVFKAKSLARFQQEDTRFASDLRRIALTPPSQSTSISILGNGAQTRFLPRSEERYMINLVHRYSVERAYIDKKQRDVPGVFTRQIEAYLRSSPNPALVSIGVDGFTCCSDLFLRWVSQQPPFYFIIIAKNTDKDFILQYYPALTTACIAPLNVVLLFHSQDFITRTDRVKGLLEIWDRKQKWNTKVNVRKSVRNTKI